jgi:predicted ArsR family transcriptional regulator
MTRLDKITEMLRTADKPLTAHQLAVGAGATITTAKHTLQVLIKRGVIHISERVPSVKGRYTCKYVYGAGVSAPEIPVYSKHSTAVRSTPTVDKVVDRQRRKAAAVGVWGGLL